MQSAISKLGTKKLLLVIIVTGLAARVTASLFTEGHWFDLDLLGDWGWNLKHNNLDDFYYVAKGPDHLPGDLWFHWMLSTAFHFFGGRHYWGDSYYFLLKMIPAVADVAITFSLFLIVRTLVSETKGVVAAAVFFLNPGIVFVASVWGQWDSVSAALLMAGLSLVLCRSDRWLWAVPIIAWATIVKPPLALPGLLILAYPVLLFLRDRGLSRTTILEIIGRLATAGALGLGTIVVLCMPFNVGLPGMQTQWTVFERANIALDLYPAKVLSAGNIWMLPQGSFDQIDDRRVTLIGLSSHELGNLYLVFALAAIAAVLTFLLCKHLRDQPHVALIWALAAVTYATFMLPTRVHERYLYPAIVFLILLNAILGLKKVGWVYLSFVLAGFLANLCFVYFGFNQDEFIDTYGDGTVAFLLRMVSIVNATAFTLLLILPIRWMRSDVGLPDSSTTDVKTAAA